MAGASLAPNPYDPRNRPSNYTLVPKDPGAIERTGGIEGWGWDPKPLARSPEDIAIERQTQARTALINQMSGLMPTTSFPPIQIPQAPSFNYGGTGTPTTTFQLPGTVSAPTVKAVAPANSEAFGRAKDASSRIHGKALESLRDEMSSRGISGSGVEARETENLLSDAARYQSEAELMQQLEAQKQAWEAAKAGYEGSVTQRGQTIGGQSAQAASASDAANRAIQAYNTSLNAWKTGIDAALEQQRLQQSAQELALRPWLQMMQSFGSLY